MIERKTLAWAAAAFFGGALVWATLSGANAENKTDTQLESDYPPSLSGTFLAAQFAGKKKKFGEAAAFYRDALAADPENLNLIELSFVLNVANGEIDEGIKLAQKLVEGDRASEIVSLVLGVEALKSRQYESAIKHLQNQSDGAIWLLTSGILTAWAEQGAKRTDDALNRVTALEGAPWYDLFKTYQLGLIAEVAGRKEEALRHFEAAYEKDNKENRALRVSTSYVSSLVKAGRIDDARAVIDGHLAKSTTDPTMLSLRGALDEGRPIVQPVTSVQAGASELLYGVGSALGREPGEELSAIYLQLAVYLDEKAELPRLALADLFDKIKLYEEANAIYDAIPDTSPMKRRAIINLSLNLDTMERTDEAEERLKGLVDSDPTDLEAIRTLGNLYRYHKKFVEAEETYSRGVALLNEPKGDDWLFFYYRGISFERTKRWPQAEEDFLKALELKPDQPDVLNYLGYSWVDQGLHLDRALGMIQRAVERRPQSGYIVDSLGWVYYRLGRYEDAVNELEKAVTIVPGDPVINDHLGDAYWKVGRKLEARFQWTRARDMKPEPDVLVIIEKKLKDGMDDEPTDAARANNAEPSSTVAQ